MFRITQYRRAIIPILLALLWVALLPAIRPSVVQQHFFEGAVFSVDNFYDEVTGRYLGEQISRSHIAYQPVERRGAAIMIDHTFDVETLDGEPIVSLYREYAIDAEEGTHVTVMGDRERSGYLFAPQGVTPEDTFSYWHINYDAPAIMRFAGNDVIEGLPVYIFESGYEDVRIDQTANLQHLPGVPEERGIELDTTIQIWVEPRTGSLISYADESTAYYYSQATGERIAPWNHFRNQLGEQTVRDRAAAIKQYLFSLSMQHIVIPALLVLAAIYLLFRPHMQVWFPRLFGPEKKRRWLQAIILLVIVGGLSVMVGWLAGIDVLKSLIPGFVTMKFTTALSFVLSGVIVYAMYQMENDKHTFASLALPGAILLLLLLMGTLLTSVFFGVSSGIESLFVSEDKTAVLTATPGLPSIGTMTNFILIGIAGVLALFRPLYRARWYWLLGVIISSIAGVALLGYTVHIHEFYYAIPQISTGMAFHTALFFLLLGRGLISCVKRDAV